ncbi:collagen triple helix repeat-containing protein 1-like isoform X2 [Dendronephthya gigantea]|uniref:collagen triple helix repeat-containing protein 1-like isoform X2 n=1 Tax=Dendronephthya gigantea TaxID=151771 RepID=UPI00106A7CBA|nr:collagen triple helix repeat-containing protein 1-like isoform X2 [Dendronephthya gigantea]
MKFSIALCFVIIGLSFFEKLVQGASCSCNCNDGGSTCPGDSGNQNTVPMRLIKQCVFPSMNDDKDAGPLKATCTYTKRESHTSLRVTFNGAMRVIGCSGGCCRRWFLTINGQECRNPATIDTSIYATGAVNRHSPKTLDGFCNEIPRGQVTVGISIGTCPGAKAGDAYTGWYSVSRIIIEEVSL